MGTTEGIVDWRIAERVAIAVAREDGSGTAPEGFDRPAIESACAWAGSRVIEYSRLGPATEIPGPELVGRADWCRAGVSTLRELSSDLDERLATSITLPGPLGSLARGAAGGAMGAEAGLAVGYAGRRVLGQYDVSLVEDSRDPRLMFVGPNLVSAHSRLGGSPRSFLRWIAAHEVTHAVQFASVPWLRGHLVRLVGDLKRGASEELGSGSLAGLAGRFLRSDPRRTIRAALRGELPRLLMSPEHAPLVDRIQATMALIEGHAEHVMDAVVAEHDPGLAPLRERLDAQRASRMGLGEVIARLMGLDLKLRQYQLGKAFCDSVAAEAGIGGLNAAWREPAALPALSELQAPAEWLARVSEPAVA